MIALALAAAPALAAVELDSDPSWHSEGDLRDLIRHDADPQIQDPHSNA